MEEEEKLKRQLGPFQYAIRKELESFEKTEKSENPKQENLPATQITANKSFRTISFLLFGLVLIICWYFFTKQR